MVSFDVVGLDWSIPPQSNLDPCAMYASQSNLERMIKQMMEIFGSKRYIAALRDGIYADAIIKMM